MKELNKESCILFTKIVYQYCKFNESDKTVEEMYNEYFNEQTAIPIPKEENKKTKDMNSEEKLNLIYDYVITDAKLVKVLAAKNEAVRQQDFQLAVTLREEEVEIRNTYIEIVGKVLNSGQNPERSVATEVDSSNQSDKQK